MVLRNFVIRFRSAESSFFLVIAQVDRARFCAWTDACFSVKKRALAQQRFWEGISEQRNPPWSRPFVELQAIVPNLPSIVVRFIIKKSEQEPEMLDHIRHFPWVVAAAFEYETVEEVIGSINDGILNPVEAKLKKLSPQRGALLGALTARR